MFTRQVKAQIGKNTFDIITSKLKMPTLAGNRQLFLHFFHHRTRLFHLSTENGRSQSIGDGHQSAYSCADLLLESLYCILPKWKVLRISLIRRVKKSKKYKMRKLKENTKYMISLQVYI